MCYCDNRSTVKRLNSRAQLCPHRGQALVEFAVVCLAVYLLLAAMLTFGQWLYSAQGLQQAVDVAAREIGRTPLPAAQINSGSSSGSPITLNYVLYGDATADPSLASVRTQVFDDNMLVLTIDQSSTGGMTYNGGHPIGDFPLVTQQLMPLMINDEVNGQQLLRFPGAMFQSSQQGYTSPAGITSSGYVVRIPVLGADGFRRRTNDHQLVVPSGADSGFERGGLVCRQCDYRLRSQRRGGLADQLSVSVGKHEWLCAAGQSGVAARSARQSPRPRTCQQQFVQLAARRWRRRYV